jgi:hypothetical protein
MSSFTLACFRKLRSEDTMAYSALQLIYFVAVESMSLDLYRSTDQMAMDELFLSPGQALQPGLQWGFGHVRDEDKTYRTGQRLSLSTPRPFRSFTPFSGYSIPTKLCSGSKLRPKVVFNVPSSRSSTTGTVPPG